VRQEHGAPTPPSKEKREKKRERRGEDSPEGKLSPRRVRKLIDIKPLGITYSEAEVQAWFTAKEPIMRARGIKDTWRAAISWWSRATREEVELAVRAERNRRFVERFGDEQDTPTSHDASEPVPSGWGTIA